MSRILISILSDYLQPNFLLIKEMEGKYDSLIFVTTDGMENKPVENPKRKSYWLTKALKLPEQSVRIIEVVEDDFEAIKRKLDSENFSKEDFYIVNLTGGTKVMPLAVYEYFLSNNYNAKFYYVPINKNVIKNLKSDSEIELRYRLNLEEYFTLNALRYEPSPDIYPKGNAYMLFNEFKQVNFNRRRHKKISQAQTLPKAEDKAYYGGAWFEEYCYYRLKNELDLDALSISHGNHIFRGDNIQFDNEIDVMFIKDNLLHIFECKASICGNASNYDMARETVKNNLDNFMYKLAAIAKDYGFRPKSYILTLYDVQGGFNEDAITDLHKRQRILGISGVKDCSDFILKAPIVPRDIKDRNENYKTAIKQPIPKQRGKFLATDIPTLSNLKILGKIDLSQISKK